MGNSRVHKLLVYITPFLFNGYLVSQTVHFDVSAYSIPSDNTISFPRSSGPLADIGIYHVGDSVSAPRRIGYCCPDFGVAQFALGNNETVPFPAIVTEDGRAYLVAGTDDRLVTKADERQARATAEEAISTWTFHPARRRGKAVPVHAIVQVRLGVPVRRVEY